MEMIDKIKAFINQNKALSYSVISIFVLLIMAKQMLKPKRRKRRTTSTPSRARRRKTTTRRKTSRRTTPKGKKAWQVKGSVAAKRHMAALRRMRK